LVSANPVIKMKTKRIGRYSFNSGPSANLPDLFDFSLTCRDQESSQEEACS
jgi:hypothetical protein